MKHISKRLIGRPVCVCAHPPKDLQSESKIQCWNNRIYSLYRRWGLLILIPLLTYLLLA